MSRTGKMEIFILLSTQNNDITRIVNWHVNLYVSCKNCKIQKFQCKCQLFILFRHGLMHSFMCRESTFSEEWKPDFHWRKFLLFTNIFVEENPVKNKISSFLVFMICKPGLLVKVC